MLYVPGNHEYDFVDFDETHVRLRNTCERLGITWLEREQLVFGDVRFVGTTLWADFDALALRPGEPEPTLRSCLSKDRRGLPRGQLLSGESGSTAQGELMLAEGWRELALVCQAWLGDAWRSPSMARRWSSRTSPSLRSADPRYGLTPPAGFCNSLDDLLPHAQWWLHGHLRLPA